MDLLVEALTRFGLPGVIIAAFFVLYVKKDRELKAECAARVADAKGYNDLAMDLQAKVLDSIAKLKEVLDELRKQNYRRSP